METTRIKRFAQYARRTLMEQVATKLKQVLLVDSPARRSFPQAVEALMKQLGSYDKESDRYANEKQVIDKVAYIWFNRFCALRFMDVNEYTSVKVLTPRPGDFQPEILSEAKMGGLDEEIVPPEIQKRVIDLLNGETPSHEPHQDAYRLLIVAVCNYYHSIMPFLFEKIADYTELLMPEDLLSGNSIVAYTREAMTPGNCESVEVIGWLYQFYISEKKDEVFASKSKVTAEEIPAATQLFTPHYIVRYMVQNSLGRLWMLNKPDSKLFENIKARGEDCYYIETEQNEEFLKISSPEELKICDPACGSGHILLYAYDLLYDIYEEEGYESKEIPQLILENNLYGIELDERAGELAAFALAMKAAKGSPFDDMSNHRRFFRNPVQPHICVMSNIHFEEGELKSYIDEIGADLFTVNLQKTLYQFEEADNFGSLIRPVLTDISSALSLLNKKSIENNIYLFETHRKVKEALKMTEFLSPKYHCVIANPPYMGTKTMNLQLAKFAKKEYPDSKADLFAMFMERTLDLTLAGAYMAMVNMQSWMFLASFEKLRIKVLDENTILTMTHLGPRGFDSIGGEVVQTTSFIIQNQASNEFHGSYLRLVDAKNEAGKQADLKEASSNHGCDWLYTASTSDFQMIPGCPIAYWLSDGIRSNFYNHRPLGKSCSAKVGLQTSDNTRFLRCWWEISFDKIGFNLASREDALESGKKWFPYNKGGDFRKWYGNQQWLVNWEYDGKEIRKYNDFLNSSRASNIGIANTDFYFKAMVGWTDITSFSQLGVRYYPEGFIFDASGPSLFTKSHNETLTHLGYLASKVTSIITNALNPTLHVQPGNIASLPSLTVSDDPAVREISTKLISITKSDWDSFEPSWEFSFHPLVVQKYRGFSLEDANGDLRLAWMKMVDTVQHLEEVNNRHFLSMYGMSNEVSSTLPLSEITLTSNPAYRYGTKKSNQEHEELLLADTMKEFISYAVGCMFGRYSLDKEGLIIANQGETLEKYLQKVDLSEADLQFVPDEDNVIPVLEEGWFEDDIVERFRVFLKTTFGEENYEQNLAFLEKSIGKDLRKYFLKDFYTEHNKMYKKRPIYWMFSSPKGSFNALIYMHRYRPDTVSIILNDYLREYRTKLEARKDHLIQIGISASASQGEKTKALKEQEKLTKIIDELEDYERDILYPLASEQKEINLDDGVKFNYNKFGKALKKVPGLSGK